MLKQYQIEEAITALQQATAVLVITGDQLGIDSGIPDYKYEWRVDEERVKRRSGGVGILVGSDGRE
jgi:hypothetical protein